MLRECGFVLVRKERIDALVREPAKIRTPWKRQLLEAGRRVASEEQLSRMAFAAHELRHLCDGVICEVLRKPEW
ncbi:MAG TPA: hypothetical protein VMW19_04295 [Myxococcota bacterium]|nr:hypothetical protein [Myxococcota bacterium]